MLKKIFMLSNKSKQPLFHKAFFVFSTFADPFYILGVDRNAQFKEIKKAFYKLANQYHPDKQNDKQSSKKFILIKQAYQQIKIQKGLIKSNRGFSYDDDASSMRPNPSQFDTSDEQFMNKQADYTIYNQKAEASANPEYQNFKGTFKTLNDINSVKIRVQKGQMKDATSRFNLEALRAKNIRRSSQLSPTAIYIFFIGMFIFWVVLVSGLDNFIKEDIEVALQQTQKKQQKKKPIFADEKTRNKQLQKQAMQKYDTLKNFATNRYEGLSKSESQKKAQLLNTDIQSV